MFDNGFQVSELYFSVLQMLRIFSDWIDETEAACPKLKKQVLASAHWLSYELTDCLRINRCARRDLNLDTKILEANLDKVIGDLQGNINILKKRIEKKRIEVESLRDGVRFLLSILCCHHDGVVSDADFLTAFQCCLPARSSHRADSESFRHCLYSRDCLLHTAWFPSCTLRSRSPITYEN